MTGSLGKWRVKWRVRSGPRTAGRSALSHRGRTVRFPAPDGARGLARPGPMGHRWWREPPGSSRRRCWPLSCARACRNEFWAAWRRRRPPASRCRRRPARGPAGPVPRTTARGRRPHESCVVIPQCEQCVGRIGSLTTIEPSCPAGAGVPPGVRIRTSQTGSGRVREPACSGSNSLPVGLASIGQPDSVCHQWSITGMPSRSVAQ